MRRLITLTVPLALAAFVVGCSGPDSEPAETTQPAAAETTQPAPAETTQPAPAETTQPEEGSGSSATITIAGFAFSGAETVSVGDTVIVTNDDSVGHTWTAVDDEFDSGTLAEGESFEFTFEESGEFDYFCSIHPSMTGSITVEG